MGGLVHADGLEEKVGKAADAANEENRHERLGLVPDADDRHDQEQKRQRHDNDCQGKFDILVIEHNDDELNGETEKEEKVVLDETNKDLVVHVHV